MPGQAKAGEPGSQLSPSSMLVSSTLRPSKTNRIKLRMILPRGFISPQEVDGH